MKYMLRHAPFFHTVDNFKKDEEIESMLLYGERIQNPEVSIMIPTFLRNKYLRETVNSALSQITTTTYEVVIVDNNDNFYDNNTLNQIKQYDSKKVSYYKNKKNLGMFGNWNRCLKLAHSDWVLILHDDDTIKDNYISAMLDIVEKNPNCAAVGCFYDEIDENGKFIKSSLKNKTPIKRKFLSLLNENDIGTIIPEDFYYTHPTNIMGLLLNKKKAMEIGGFDARWDPISDYVFIVNLALKNKIKIKYSTLFNYRIAVNSSLSMDHVIGMGCVGAYLQEELFSQLHMHNAVVDRYFRDNNERLVQREIIQNWGSRLSNEDMNSVCKVFTKLNKEMGFKSNGHINTYLIHWIRRWRRILIHYVRK